MIYITGDTHGPLEFERIYTFYESNKISSDDYLLICGDFGGIWDGGRLDRSVLDFYSDQLWKVLFIDGNHENFDLLNSYPVTEWRGGRVHRINEQVYHLMRGQIYTIENRKFFTMGGATSIDRYNRKEGISWWPQEMPSSEEYEEAFANLRKNNNKVNYIITHCAPDLIQDQLSNQTYEHNKLTNFLEIVRQDVQFNAWYFGHYHQDHNYFNRYFPMYNRIIPIEGSK